MTLRFERWGFRIQKATGEGQGSFARLVKSSPKCGKTVSGEEVWWGLRGVGEVGRGRCKIGGVRGEKWNLK